MAVMLKLLQKTLIMTEDSSAEQLEARPVLQLAEQSRTALKGVYKMFAGTGTGTDNADA